MSDLDFIILFVFVGIVALVVLAAAAMAIILGAVYTFAFANEQGFVGIAVYFALWYALPIYMLVACVIVGVVEMLRKNA